MASRIEALKGIYYQSKSDWFGIREPMVPKGHTNWERFKLAHPGHSHYHPRTFGFLLDSPFNPPNDVHHMLVSHQRGVIDRQNCYNGSDFLFNGNYIHPDIKVCYINDKAVQGKVYYPGTAWDVSPVFEPPTRNWLEVLSPHNLDLKNGETYTIKLTLDRCHPE